MIIPIRKVDATVSLTADKRGEDFACLSASNDLILSTGIPNCDLLGRTSAVGSFDLLSLLPAAGHHFFSRQPRSASKFILATALSG